MSATSARSGSASRAPSSARSGSVSRAASVASSASAVTSMLPSSRCSPLPGSSLAAFFPCLPLAPAEPDRPRPLPADTCTSALVPLTLPAGADLAAGLRPRLPAGCRAAGTPSAAPSSGTRDTGWSAVCALPSAEPPRACCGTRAPCADGRDCRRAAEPAALATAVTPSLAGWRHAVPRPAPGCSN